MDNKNITEQDQMPQPIIPQEIRAFLEGCLAEKGVQSVSEETKELMIGDLAGRLNQWLFTTSFSRLSPQDQQAFSELVEQNEPNPQLVEQFFRSHVADIDQVYAVAMMDFKRTYLGK